MINPDEIKSIQSLITEASAKWDGKQGVLLVFFDASDGSIVVSAPVNVDKAAILETAAENYRTKREPDWQDVSVHTVSTGPKTKDN
jgi:hypothetical protein